MNVLRAATLVVYTFGAFAYGALLALWVRDAWGQTGVRPASDQGEARAEALESHAMLVSGALWSVCFLWFITNLAIVMIRLSPARPGGWLWSSALWAGLWLACAFPPLIMHMVSTEARVNHGDLLPRGWRAIVWVSYTATAVLAAGSTLAFLGVGDVPEPEVARIVNTGVSGMFIIAALYSIAILFRYPAKPGKARDVRSTRWHIGLFSAMVLIFVFVFLALDDQTSLSAVAGATIELIAKSLPLLFLFVGAYFESRFEFFDIFVKRGLSLVVTMALLAFAFALLRPVLVRYDDSWAAPWVYAVLLLPLAMALPWLHARIGAMLDRRWLGRRFSTVAALKQFLSGLRSATTEAQLLERAETGLSGIFDAPAVVTLDGRPHAPPDGFKCVQQIAIPSSSGTAGWFLLGGRRNEAPYFSEDVALLGSLADVFASVLDNLRLQLREQEQDRRARDLSLHASRSELKALRAQINPHFLFNALNAIAGLIHRDPAVADRTIEKLADVFRYALRGAETEWTMLEDELEFVRAYLDVEQARFGTRLRTDVQVSDAVRRARVPTMVVQTLVENAVKHGAATVRGQAVVTVSARREEDRLLIAVEDNGPGFAAPQELSAAAAARRGGYGIVNIRKRLEGYFGDAAALSVNRDEGRGRTVVSIAMPFTLQEPRGYAAAAETAK